MTPIPRAFSGLTLTAENAYSSSTTLTSLMWKIWTTVHRFSAAATAAPRSMPSRPAQTARSGSTAGQTFTRMTARWGPPLSELIQLDAHGTLLRTIIPANEEDPNSTGDWGYSHLDTLLSDDKGYVYTYDYQTVNVYGPDGSFVFSKSADELSGQLCQLSAGEVGALTTYNDGKMAFKQLDPETKNWGKETPVSSRAWSLQPGNDVYRYFFIDGGNIFGERKDTGEVEKVVDWLACDVDSNTIRYNRLDFLADGRIATVTLGHSYDRTRERQRILVLNRMDAADVQQKTELTLACFSLDYNLRSQIVKFNQTSTDCRIVVRDYAEYADGEDYYAGLTVFNTEVLAGKIPDLIVGNMMLPIRQYAARGMLENLWPYLDADPGYSRDKLMTRPVEAAQVDGKLYQLPINFWHHHGSRPRQDRRRLHDMDAG